MGGRDTRMRRHPAVGARVPPLCLGLSLALALAFPVPLLSQPVLRPPPTGSQPPVAGAVAGGAAEAPAPAPASRAIAQLSPPPRPAAASEPASGSPPGSGRPERKPETPASAPAVAKGGDDAAPDAPAAPTPAPKDAATGKPATDSDAADRRQGGAAKGIASEPAPDPAPDPGAAAPDAAHPPQDAADPAMSAAPLYQGLRESRVDHALCRVGLRFLGVEATAAPAVTDPDDRDCGIARPVEVRAIQPGLVLESPALMRCETARQLALWMRDTVIPAARWLEGSPRISSVTLGTSYACRGVVGGASTARLSEHALGNAVDIAGFGLADGRRLSIAPRGDSGTIEMAFQNAVQAGACLYFTTVLGPGSNEAHDDHLHLDIKARRNDFRLCQ